MLSTCVSLVPYARLHSTVSTTRPQKQWGSASSAAGVRPGDSGSVRAASVGPRSKPTVPKPSALRRQALVNHS